MTVILASWQARHGTAGAGPNQWPATFVLKDGELGYEEDTGKLKIGNGVTQWSSLGYVAGGTAGTPLLKVGAEVTTTGTHALPVNTFTKVTAAATMTLPTGQPEGSLVAVEDGSTATPPAIVTVKGKIRGSTETTVQLTLANETMLFVADVNGFWWPVASHKTKAALETLLVPRSIMGTAGGPALAEGYGVAFAGAAPLDKQQPFFNAATGKLEFENPGGAGSGINQAQAEELLARIPTAVTTAGTYTVSAADAGKMLEFTGTAAQKLVIPSGITIPAGNSLVVEATQIAAFELTVEQGAGMTLRPKSPLKVKQWGSIAIRLRSSTEAIVVGEYE